LIIMNIKAEFPIFEYANKYDLCFKSRAEAVPQSFFSIRKQKNNNLFKY
jgi:hypothetical protein